MPTESHPYKTTTGIIEMVSVCAFRFKDVYGNRLRVTTEGEEVPRWKSYARVSGFQFVCE